MLVSMMHVRLSDSRTMIETVQIDFQLVLVQQLIVPSRRAAALHSTKVLAPARSTGVLFQALFFRSPKHTQNTKRNTYTLTNQLTEQSSLTHLF